MSVCSWTRAYNVPAHRPSAGRTQESNTRAKTVTSLFSVRNNRAASNSRYPKKFLDRDTFSQFYVEFTLIHSFLPVSWNCSNSYALLGIRDNVCLYSLEFDVPRWIHDVTLFRYRMSPMLIEKQTVEDQKCTNCTNFSRRQRTYAPKLSLLFSTKLPRKLRHVGEKSLCRDFLETRSSLMYRLFVFDSIKRHDISSLEIITVPVRHGQGCALLKPTTFDVGSESL